MDKQPERDLSRQLNQSHGSFELVLSPVILGLIGWWFDGRLGSGPVLTVMAAVVGLCGAVAKLVIGYRTTMAAHAVGRAAPTSSTGGAT